MPAFLRRKSAASWSIFPISQWPQQRSKWQTLHKKLGANQLLRVELIDAAIQEFANTDVQIACMDTDGEAASMALVQSSGPAQWQLWQPSQLPIGPLLTASSTNLRQLCSDLLAALGPKSLLLGITQLDPNDHPRPRDGGALGSLDYIETACLNIEEDFESYWAKRGKNLRQNMRRQQNRLDREGTECRIECLRSPAEMATAVAAYGELEAQSWKAEGGTAITADNDQGRFYTQVLETLCHLQCARVYQLYYDNKLVATDLCMDDGETLVVLKTTYDQSITTSSPAMLLRKHYFEQIFSEGGFTAIEFYGKVMDWHRKLTEDIRVMYHINVYRWALIPRLRQMQQRLTAPKSSASNAS